MRRAVLLCVLPLMSVASESMLISTAALAARLEDPSTVILHVGSEKDYAAGHVPGARLLTLPDISVTGDRGLRLELPPVEALVAAFGKVGVTDASRIVVYHGTDSIQSATRVWFTLDYLGLGDRAALLDGGLAGWRAEGRPLSTDTPPPVAPARFSVKPNPALVVDAAWIQQHAKDSAVDLIDARTPEFYTGTSPGSMPRAGRIPGARSVPYPTLLDSNGKLKPAAELRQALPGGRLAVTYCHIGQQATVPYFVSRYLGRDVRLYDGSFQDWSMRSELPVEVN